MAESKPIPLPNHDMYITHNKILIIKRTLKNVEEKLKVSTKSLEAQIRVVQLLTRSDKEDDETMAKTEEEMKKLKREKEKYYSLHFDKDELEKELTSYTAQLEANKADFKKIHATFVETHDWKIHNIRDLIKLTENGKFLHSTVFEMDEVPGVTWQMFFYPTGKREADSGSFALFLRVSGETMLHENHQIADYTFHFLNDNRESLWVKSTIGVPHTFSMKNDQSWGFRSLDPKKIANILTKDGSLYISCRIEVYPPAPKTDDRQINRIPDLIPWNMEGEDWEILCAENAIRQKKRSLIERHLYYGENRRNLPSQGIVVDKSMAVSDNKGWVYKTSAACESLERKWIEQKTICVIDKLTEVLQTSEDGKFYCFKNNCLPSSQSEFFFDVYIAGNKIDQFGVGRNQVTFSGRVFPKLKPGKEEIIVTTYTYSFLGNFNEVKHTGSFSGVFVAGQPAIIVRGDNTFSKEDLRKFRRNDDSLAIAWKFSYSESLSVKVPHNYINNILSAPYDDISKLTQLKESTGRSLVPITHSFFNIIDRLLSIASFQRTESHRIIPALPPGVEVSPYFHSYCETNMERVKIKMKWAIKDMMKVIESTNIGACVSSVPIRVKEVPGVVWQFSFYGAGITNVGPRKSALLVEMSTEGPYEEVKIMAKYELRVMDERRRKKLLNGGVGYENFVATKSASSREFGAKDISFEEIRDKIDHDGKLTFIATVLFFPKFVTYKKAEPCSEIASEKAKCVSENKEPSPSTHLSIIEI